MNYKDQNDATLVDLTLLGNESAFEELVKRWQTVAMRIAVSVTNNHYTAEDAVQDAFVTAWQRLDTLRDKSKFGAWVCRITRYRTINLATRYRDFIPFELIENSDQDLYEDLFGYFNDDRECEKLHMHVENLSEKLKTVIKMFYFEGLSLENISKKTNLSVGTVKSRLHDGRVKLRKEMGLMDKHNDNETLLEAVMRRVEELKRWRLRQSKKGFEQDYNECLADVEGLPESEQKYHALADVLNLGFWYLSGDEKKEELEKKIKEAAIKGNNREVLGYAITRTANGLSGQPKIDHNLNTVIPKLEQYGLTEAIGSVYFWIGFEYYDQLKDSSKAREYYSKALEILPPSDVYHATAIAALSCLDNVADYLNDKMKYRIEVTGEEYRLDGTRLLFWSQPGFTRGYLNTYSDRANADPTYYISRTDSIMYDEAMTVGETIKSFDNTATLTFVSDDAEVDTPCGTFRNCCVFVCCDNRFKTTVYFKRNIGIVAYEHISKFAQNTETKHASFKLASYKILGGTGMIPFAKGNLWTYSSNRLDGLCEYEIKYEVTYFDGKKAILTHPCYVIKNGYDKTRWDDLMGYLRNFYIRDLGENAEELNDLSAEMQLAEELAKTPWQKAHTEVANSVMRRFYATDPDFDPNAKEKGYRNFFNLLDVSFDNGKVFISDNRDYGFEWKDYSPEAQPLLYNDLYKILSENVGCLWNSNTKAGDSFTYTCPVFRKNTDFVCNVTVDACEPITVKAGKFENCIKLSYGSNHETWTNGALFRVVDADWYFADKIGLIKAVFKLDNFTREITYELASYKGEGDGYMPIIPDTERYYELVGEDAKLHGSVRYVFAANDDGDLKILADQKGTIDI
ncbi:MAG: RNA polymerase sigma factor [Clostridia bacterium]|nr:RNA polymerase sigma factor [Clostridia bacterium]